MGAFIDVLVVWKSWRPTRVSMHWDQSWFCKYKTELLVYIISALHHSHVKLIANRWPLGTGALNVGRGPEQFMPGQGAIHGNPMSGNHPCKQLPTGTVTLNQISGKILTWPPIQARKVWNIWRGERGGDSSRCTSANWSSKISINPQRFAKTKAKWSAAIS